MLTCLLADLLGSDTQFLDARLLAAYGHPGAVDVGARMRRVGAGLVASGTRPLQEPYSIRCAPQLLGAAEDALRYVDAVVGADLASVTDNPLFFPDDDLVVHGGNFFGQPAAFAADVLSMVVAQVGNLAERQLDLLVDPNRNGGLPPMLAAGPGQQHGLQGVQLAATALITEIRRDTMPASMQSVPTNLHNQDVVPLGTQAALRALDQTRLLHLRRRVARGGTAPGGVRRRACADRARLCRGAGRGGRGRTADRPGPAAGRRRAARRRRDRGFLRFLLLRMDAHDA